MAISSAAIPCATPPACMPSPASWKSRTPLPRHAWSPTAGICGTPACSCSPRARCWRNWKRTRRTCCRRCARRSLRAAPISTSSGSTRRRSPRRPRSAWTTRSPNAPPGRRGAGRYRLVRRRQLGRAVGARRQGRGRQRRRRRRAAGERARTATCAATACWPRWSGLSDAVVVVTEDAVLAMHRDQAQDVKKIVDRLKAAGRHEAVAHNRAVSAVGVLRKPDPGRPLPGEAHRRARRATSCRCRSISIAPSIGWWSAAPRW